MENTRKEELRAVSDAYQLESTLDKYRIEAQILLDTAPPEPSEPVLEQEEISKEKYPEITKKDVGIVNYSRILLLMMFIEIMFIDSIYLGSDFYLLLIILTFVGFVFWRFKEHKEFEARKIKMKESDKYKERCLLVDEQNQIKQEEKNKELLEKYNSEMKIYEKEKKEYDEVLAPPFFAKYQEFNNRYEKLKNELAEVYKRGIIPHRYQNFEAVTFLNEYMSSSSFDLKYAIEEYKHHKEEENRIAREAREAEDRRIQMELQEEENARLASINRMQKAELAYNFLHNRKVDKQREERFNR